MIMQRCNGQKVDSNNFKDIYNYVHRLVEAGYIVNSLIVSPQFYKKILMSELWYEVRRAADYRGYIYIEVGGGVTVEIKVNSAMDGNFCIDIEN